jgi:hypothetical protein
MGITTEASVSVESIARPRSLALRRSQTSLQAAARANPSPAAQTETVHQPSLASGKATLVAVRPRGPRPLRFPLRACLIAMQT